MRQNVVKNGNGIINCKMVLKVLNIIINFSIFSNSHPEKKTKQKKSGEKNKEKS
jgi:hypothetical protein